MVYGVFGRLIIEAVLCVFEEGVVFLDVADVRAGLLQLGHGGAALGLGGVMLEDALEGVIGGLAQGEHALGGVLDVLFRVAAR